MIDTITLDLQDFEVDPYPNLELQQARTNLKTGEVIGREANLFHGFTGTKAIGNTAKTHVDIFLGRDNKVHAITHFSVPKQVADNNYSEVDFAGFLNALALAETDLLTLGVRADLDKARLTRLDLFKNVITNEPIVCYAKVFELLNASYAKDKRTYGVSGWLMGNSQQQYCIYDKVAELKQNNKGVNFDDLPDTLRFEHRSLTASKVESTYGFTTIEDLKRYGWDALYDKRREIWRDGFFKYDVQDFETLVVSVLKKYLQFYQTKGSRYWFEDFLRSYGAVSLYKIAGMEVVKKALEDMGCNRMKIYRLEQTMKQRVFEFEALEAEQNSRIDLGTLYSELKNKVLA